MLSFDGFDSGGSLLDYGTTSAASEGGQTWLPDSWGGWDFLSGGLNVWKDYMQISGKGAFEVPAGVNPDQFAEQARPVDATTAQQSMNQARQLVPGVGNGVLLLGGLGVLALVLWGGK